MTNSSYRARGTVEHAIALAASRSRACRPTGRGACVFQFAPGIPRAGEIDRLVVAADDHDRALRSDRASSRALRRSTLVSAPAAPNAPPPRPPPPAGDGHAAAEVVALRRIGRAQRDHRAAVAHEHRLAVVAERDVRELTAPLVDQLGVAGAVRRDPAHVAHARRRRARGRYRAPLPPAPRPPRPPRPPPQPARHSRRRDVRRFRRQRTRTRNTRARGRPDSS